MYDDEELDDGYYPGQFKKGKSFNSDVISTFVQPLEWYKEDEYYIEIKWRVTGELKEKGGPYSLLLADQIMNDLKSKNENQQYAIEMKRKSR